LLVDDDVVVEPTQQSQPVGVVATTVALGGDVVGFEAVAAGTAVGGAGSVPVEDVVAGPVGYAVPICGYCFQPVDIYKCGLGFAHTEDLFKGVGSDFEPGAGDCPGFASAVVAFGGVDEDLGF
jgi:hypothetical protein